MCHAMSSCLLSPSLQWPLPEGLGRAASARPPHALQPCALSPQECGLLRKGTVLLADNAHLPGAPDFLSTCAGAAARVLAPARPGVLQGGGRLGEGRLQGPGSARRGPEPCSGSPGHACSWRARRPSAGLPSGQQPHGSPCSSRLSRWPAPSTHQLPFQSRGRPSKAAACEDQLGEQWL